MILSNYFNVSDNFNGDMSEYQAVRCLNKRQSVRNMNNYLREASFS